MTLATELNTSFSSQIPGLQIAWDSTSLGALKKCPYYYKLAIIDGWQSKIGNCHLEFGIAYHSGTEYYDHLRAQGQDHERALLAAVAKVMENTWDADANRPWTSEDPNKNRFTLIRTLVWYLDRFKDDPFKTVILANGKPAVELSFRLELDFGPQSLPESKYLLCGHLDKLSEMDGQLYISDKKSTKHTLDEKYFTQYSPDNQMSTYTFAGRIIAPGPISGIAIDAAQVAVTFSRFQRHFVSRTPEQLDEWYAGIKILLRQAEQYAAINFWPQNDKACFGCEFRDVCRRSPSVRQAWLEGRFVKRVWDPLKIRGDI